MSITSTLLIFVALPAAVVAVVYALGYAGGERSGHRRRYRPGRPFEFRPVWFVAAPEQVAPALGGPDDGYRALPPGRGAPALEAAAGSRGLPGATGGASDRW